MNNKLQNNALIYGKKLSEKIENEEILRKCLPNHGEVYSGAREEIALFQYRRYLGSLRCLLDLKNMEGMVYLGY